jgi:hypothetical protein
VKGGLVGEFVFVFHGRPPEEASEYHISANFLGENVAVVAVVLSLAWKQFVKQAYKQLAVCH